MTELSDGAPGQQVLHAERQGGAASTAGPCTFPFRLQQECRLPRLQQAIRGCAAFRYCITGPASRKNNAARLDRRRATTPCPTLSAITRNHTTSVELTAGTRRDEHGPMRLVLLRNFMRQPNLRHTARHLSIGLVSPDIGKWNPRMELFPIDARRTGDLRRAATKQCAPSANACPMFLRRARTLRNSRAGSGFSKCYVTRARLQPFTSIADHSYSTVFKRSAATARPQVWCVKNDRISPLCQELARIGVTPVGETRRDCHTSVRVPDKVSKSSCVFAREEVDAALAASLSSRSRFEID
jgi:hypothetical protein